MLNKIVFRDNENDTSAGAAPRAGGRRRAAPRAGAPAPPPAVARAAGARAPASLRVSASFNTSECTRGIFVFNFVYQSAP